MRPLFLLGGYDLEMLEIRKLLQDKKVPFFDVSAPWGAKLSAYHAHFGSFRDYSHVYGIELIEDIPAPENYIRIDHHNDFSDRQASILQVAEILGIPPDRRMNLVAANDGRYIPGLVEIGATKEEIEAIRLEDRAAQGVTQEEETAAGAAIEALKCIEDLTVVFYAGSHFSPITDRLWGKTKNRLLVYNKEKFTYYGVGAEQFAKRFHACKPKANAYWGGGVDGFFGGDCSDTPLERILNFVLLGQGNDIYSKHIFIFPFKWEKYLGVRSVRTSLSGRANVNEFANYLELGAWKQFTFEAKVEDGYNRYNEYAYFYDFARDVLNISQDPEASVRIAQFEYQAIDREQACFRIETLKGNYALQLNDILLNIYENGVGLLVYVLENKQHPDSCDIRRINDFGRRLYPQFLGIKNTNLTQDTKGAFLATKIILEGVRTIHGHTIEEDFSHFDTEENVKRLPNHLPNHVMALLGTGVKDHPNLAKINDFLVLPLLDDRMFVMCFAFDRPLVSDLICIKENDNNDVSWKTNADWYRYLFVDDGTMSCPDPEMQKRLIEKATYTRWINRKNADESIFFGVTRYSFIMLAAKCEGFAKDVLLKHFEHMYFQLVLLTLLQRASIIQFSGEVARIARRLTAGMQDIEDEQVNIAHLYVQYIKFVNRIFFREVTPQEQGIELYDLLQEQMRIREEVKDLREEIAELNTYTETKLNSQLTIVASLFLPSGFMAALLALFGLNWPDSNAGLGIVPYILGIVSFAMLSLFFSKPLIRIIKKWGGK